MTNFVADQLSMTDLLTKLNLNSLRHLIFHVVFNKILSANKVRRPSEAGQVSQPVPGQLARAGRPVNIFLHCLEAI